MSQKGADRFLRLLARAVKQYCLYNYGLVPSLQAISVLRVSATKTASKARFRARNRPLNLKISTLYDFAKFLKFLLSMHPTLVPLKLSLYE